jgi:hypothetical protein
MAYQVVAKTVESEKFKFEKAGQVLEGYLVGTEIINFDDKDVPKYTIQTTDGNKGILASYQLKEGLEKLPMNTKVRITFNGKVKLKGGKTMNDFKIESDVTDVLKAS